MQKAELELILQELYTWNPKLKKRETELINLINKMIEAKPDTKFDTSFAESLKKDLLSHRILLDNDDGLKDNHLLFNLNPMNKTIYTIAGSVAVIGVIALFIIVSEIPINRVGKLSLVKNSSSSEQLVKSAPRAFGSLTALSASSSIAATGAAAKGTVNTISGNIAVSPAVSEVSTLAITSDGLAVASPNITTRTVDSVSGKMIAPIYSFKFEYTGEPLILSDETGTVYRRLKGDGNLSTDLDSLISSKTFGPISLSSFSNLKVNSISLVENKKLGLNINIDFNDDNIYLSENWLQWQSDRDNCGDDEACWNSYRIKINDFPADTNLIAISNDFLTGRNVSLEHYDSPIVDNNWRANYEAATDKANFYIPEYATLVYPLIVNGQSVFDQSGNPDGLRVTINLLQKAVSGVSNLMPYRYEASDYALETSSDQILGLAKKGGNNYNYYNSGEQKELTLELGTPTKSLVRYFRYLNNTNDELLVPALIFPIKNAPVEYYGSKFITVPLVKEMAAELYGNGSTGGGGIMPMVR